MRSLNDAPTISISQVCKADTALWTVNVRQGCVIVALSMLYRRSTGQAACASANWKRACIKKDA
jgi:hypothetical protein